MVLTLVDELLHCAALWRNEERLACDAVVVGDLAAVCSDLLQPCARALEAVAACLGVLTVEAANAIGR